MSILRLKARLLLWGLLLCVVPLLGVSFFLPNYIGREMVRRAETELRLSADAMATLLEREFAHNKALVSSHADYGGYREALLRLRQGSLPVELYGEMERHAQTTIMALGERCQGVVLADASGLVVLAVGHRHHTMAETMSYGVNISDRPYFAQIKATLQVVVSDPLYSRLNGPPVVVFAAPVLDAEGHLLGVLALAQELDFFSSMVSGVSLGEGSIGFAVDRTGMVVAHPDAERILKVDFMALDGTREIAAGMREGKRGLSHYVNSRGLRKVGAYAPVPTAGWSVVMSMEDSVLFATGQHVRKWILWLAFGTAIVASAALLNQAHTLSAREAEHRALVASEEKFSRAFSANPSAMVIVRCRDSKVLDANEAFCRLFEIPADKLCGLCADQIDFWRDSPGRAHLLAKLASGAGVKNEPINTVSASGAMRHCLISVETITLAGQVCFLALVQDVTQVRQSEQEQERLQAQLMQAQKVEALGQLSGGVAHDFNNILAVVQLQLSFLVTVEKLSPESVRLAEESMATIRSGAALTSQLLQFSRRKEVKWERLDFVQLLQELSRMLQRLIGERHVLELGLPAEPLHVWADQGMMQQVVLNLVVNARDAMPSGGTIWVSLAGVPSEGPEAERRLQLRVVDSGIGMTDETKARIFEPFFTTKDPGKGTGLGLSTTMRIVQQHQGRLDVESELGKGSRFTVWLPLHEEPDLPGQAEVRSEPLRVRRGEGVTILYVEDDAPTREMAVFIMRQQGYRVYPAATADEGLRVWRAHSEEIRLFVTDLMMPGQLLGLDLLRVLRAEVPTLPVLITSGHAEEEAGDELPGAQPLRLAKPFRSTELLRALDQLLRQRDDAGPDFDALAGGLGGPSA